jgi:hypothetical protein
VAIRATPVRQAKAQPQPPAPRVEVLALAEPAGADPRAAVAAIRPEPARAATPPVRQPAVRVSALPNPRVPMSASELTFAKGYAKRRAALQAANTAVAAAGAEITLPAKLKSGVGASRAERYDRSHRVGPYAHHGGTHRYAAYDRYDGYNREASHGRQRAHDRYGGYRRYAHDDRVNDGR